MLLFTDMNDFLQRVCRCGIRALDGGGVDVQRCGGLCMAQAARNRRNRGMGGNQQAGIGVTQTVEMHRREIMSG